jgi:hypothetical protein
MHLTDHSYRSLLDGSVRGAEALALADHLDAACETCEAWLAARQEADGLDGSVDAALLSLAARPALAPRDDLAFARMERALWAGEAGAGRPQLRGAAGGRRRWLGGLAVAATLALAGAAGLIIRVTTPSGPGWDGDKGRGAAAVPLRLRFAVVSPAVGGPPTLEKGISGQEVAAAASLQFQVELGRPAHVLLARVGSGGAPEVFFSARLEAGRHGVSLAGRPAAYPLAELSGVQRFLALASPAPLDPADAARAATLGVGTTQERGAPITLDEVEVRIRP